MSNYDKSFWSWLLSLQANQNRETAELFVNVLDIIMDSELPDDYGPSYGRSVSSVRSAGVHISSCSLNSLNLGSLQSPTEKENAGLGAADGSIGSGGGSNSALGRVRHGSASQISLRRISNFKRQVSLNMSPKLLWNE